eukprot:3512403-Rhodomonas_salina.1
MWSADIGSDARWEKKLMGKRLGAEEEEKRERWAAHGKRIRKEMERWLAKGEKKEGEAKGEDEHVGRPGERMRGKDAEGVGREEKEGGKKGGKGVEKEGGSGSALGHSETDRKTETEGHGREGGGEGGEREEGREGGGLGERGGGEGGVVDSTEAAYSISPRGA